MQKFENIFIVGLGLMGGSLVRAIHKNLPNVSVIGIDENANARAAAQKAGVAAETFPHLPQTLPSNCLVVLACHIDGVLKTIEQLAPLVEGREDVLVTDLSSVKRPIMDAAAEYLPAHFIGGHPMAGRETHGFDSSVETLFEGKLFIITPPSSLKNTPALEQLSAFIKALNMGTLVLDAPTHDRVMAYVSHFPHVYALLITKLLHDSPDGENLLRCHGGGLADQIRLAGSNATMWNQVFEHNKDNLQEVLEGFASLLVRANGHLDDNTTMTRWWDQANHVHEKFADFRRQMAYDPFAPFIEEIPDEKN